MFCPVYASISAGDSSFLPEFRNMHVRLSGDCKVPLGMNVYICSYLSHLFSDVTNQQEKTATEAPSGSVVNYSDMLLHKANDFETLTDCVMAMILFTADKCFPTALHQWEAKENHKFVKISYRKKIHMQLWSCKTRCFKLKPLKCLMFSVKPSQGHNGRQWPLTPMYRSRHVFNREQS